MLDQEGVARHQTELSTTRRLSASTLALFFLSRAGASLFFERKVRTKVKPRITFTAGSTTQRMLSKKTARRGMKAKPLGAWGAGGFAV